MIVKTLFLVMITAWIAGAIASLVTGRSAIARSVASLGAGIGSAACLLLGMASLVTGQALTLHSARLLPISGLMLRLDGLGAFFLVIIGLIGLAAAIYGFGYSANYAGRYSLRMGGAMLNLLLLALGLQVMADNALTFLIAWEAMSLSAYWLVLTEHDKGETVRAAGWYLAMTHAGFAALMAMFLLMAGGDLTASFSGMRSNAAALSSGSRNVIFVLALFGFGSKAGIVPLHVWLPMAASGRAEPRVGAVVGRGDQDGDLRAGARDARSARRGAGLVGRSRAGSWRALRAARRALRVDGT